MSGSHEHGNEDFVSIHLVDVDIFRLLVTLDENHKVIRIHPLTIMDVCFEFNANPSNSREDIFGGARRKIKELSKSISIIV